MHGGDAAFVLTVLGAGPSWPNPDGACSGYLLSANGSHLLVDCGSGVAGRLLAHVRFDDLAGVVVSHLHPDHMLDLVTLRQGISHGPLGGARPLSVLVPPDGARRLAELGRALNGNERFFSGTFEVCEYNPASAIELGPFTVAFREVQHSLRCYAMRIGVGPASAALVFSGDTGFCDALIEHARGAGTLLCEATLERADQGDPDPAKRDHLAPSEAGEIARRVGAGRLLLTHLPIDPNDPNRAVREASAVFGGPVERAVEGRRYTL